MELHFGRCSHRMQRTTEVDRVVGHIDGCEEKDHHAERGEPKAPPLSARFKLRVANQMMGGGGSIVKVVARVTGDLAVDDCTALCVSMPA